jgi:hypothetical protein
MILSRELSEQYKKYNEEKIPHEHKGNLIIFS